MGEWIESLKIEVDVYWDFLLLVIGALLGVIIQKLMDKYSENHRRRVTRKRVKELSCNDDLNILTLGSGMPAYKPNHLNLRTLGKSFYIGFPQELLQDVLAVDPNFEIHDDFLFHDHTTLDQLGEQMAIPQFSELVDKHRYIMARHFIEQTNGCYNNQKKYGVYSINIINAIDKEEKAGATLELFDTDYFTHRIMRSIYSELKAQNHPISQLEIGNIRHELSRYNAFTTSLGINLFLIMHSEHGESIIFSQRSAHAAHEESRYKYNSTVMEGISQTDYEHHEEAVSLMTGARRALHEELGISPDLIDLHIEFHDIFLQKDFFEIGFTASASSSCTFEEVVRDLPAKDKELEIARLVPVPLESKKLSEFIKSHEMYPQGLYTLKMVAARRKKIILHYKNK